MLPSKEKYEKYSQTLVKTANLQLKKMANLFYVEATKYDEVDNMQL